MRSRAFQITGAAASLMALCFMLGGHWLALQSVAWARMLGDFAQSSAWTEAIVKTFDGEHPCRMCVSIAESRQEEQREEREFPLLKPQKSPELFCELRRTMTPFAPGLARDAVAFIPILRSDFHDSPPTPPPRSFIAVL